MIKAVIFDYYGVMCPRIVPLLTEGTARQFVISHKKSLEVIDYLLCLMDENKLTFYKYWRTLKSELKNKEAKLSDHQRIWEESLSKLDLWPQMTNLVKKIKKSGYTVPLLSNVLRKTAIYNKRKGRYDLFKPVLLSYKMGIRKPSPTIFKHALKKLRLKAEECVFIDDRTSYLEGAKSLGIKTIHFKNYSRLVRDLKRVGIHGI